MKNKEIEHNLFKSVAEDDATIAALERALQTLDEVGAVRTPALEGTSARALGRALHRRWVERGAFAPLMCVRAEVLDECTHTPRWWEAARGGWLLIEGAPSARAGRALDALADEPVCVLTIDDAEASPASPTLSGHITDLDRGYACATDPGLRGARASLARNLSGASTVHLVGEPHTDKVALARWAHQGRDPMPLAHVRRGEGDASTSRWELFEDVDALEPRAQDLLRDALTRREPRAPWRAPSRAARPRPEHPALAPIVGRSAAMVRLLERLVRLAPSTLPVLITGEPGVGKELFARALHEASGRAGAFVALDAGALAQSLVESALFGHRRGAFTGATSDRDGAFRAAHGGTLFLDELGNLSLDLQRKLLRALQEGQVLPVGADRPVEVDVRVVAATNADLGQMTRAGTFREDLLGRLNAATLKIPPLRERIEDLEELAARFYEARRGEAPAGAGWCAPEVWDALRAYAWPGNVRELGHAIDYALTMSDEGERVERAHVEDLAPMSRRDAPLITTRSAPEEDALPWDLEPRLRQLMSLTTLRVPPLRARSEESRRHRVLERLGGCLVTEAALEVLAAQPWWGNTLELEARLSELRAAGGVVDMERLEESSIRPRGVSASAPITLALSPTRGRDGRVEALRWELDAGAALLGRVRAASELRVAAARGDARAARALGRIEEISRGGRVACVDLGFSARLSRAHVLITRGEGGLRAHVLAERSGRVVAGPLGRGMSEVSGGGSAALGDAGELCVLGRDGAPTLHVFVFAGPLAWERRALTAWESASAMRGAPGPTLTSSLVRGGVKASDAGTSGQRVWTLEGLEVEWLTDVVMGFAGGPFKHHAHAMCDDASAAGLARLVNYLRRAPRVAQYVVRLYERQENHALRDALRGRLEVHEDPERLVSGWPKGLRAIAGDAQ